MPQACQICGGQMTSGGCMEVWKHCATNVTWQFPTDEHIRSIVRDELDRRLGTVQTGTANTSAPMCPRCHSTERGVARAGCRSSAREKMHDWHDSGFTGAAVPARGGRVNSEPESHGAGHERGLATPGQPGAAPILTDVGLGMAIVKAFSDAKGREAAYTAAAREARRLLAPKPLHEDHYAVRRALRVWHGEPDATYTKAGMDQMRAALKAAEEGG